MARIGVFVCHCGENIARNVDVKKVSEVASTFRGVVFSTDYLYMCSDPGQNLIKETIRRERLTGVVVAACSPHLHEATFRKAAREAGLNPYLVEMANIREHCSWVHEDREKATKKAVDLVRAMVEKVRFNHPLSAVSFEIEKKALVIGGGVSGIQAALDIADGGIDVVLVEKEPSIGGHMAMLSETFPTLDCSQCILTPKMVDAARHPKIKLLTYSEIEEVNGFVGNFTVRIRKKARSVREDVCTGCRLCVERCPVRNISDEFNRGLSSRPAIYIPFPQAVPNVPVIDRKHCVYFLRGKCKLCEKVCKVGAIDYGQEDKIIEERIGAIVVAVGYSLYSIGKKPENSKIKGYGEYGYGKYKDLIDGLQFERILSASGPTGGKIKRPSDGKEPKVVVFISCVGSRSKEKGIDYCSKVCCMYVAKQALLYKQKVKDGRAYVFYIDIRASGKEYEEFVRRVIEEEGVVYLRGKVSKIYQENGKLVCLGADTLSMKPVRIEADLVVLANAILPTEGIEELARKLRISYDQYGFLKESHPKLRPVETNTQGIFICGTCHSPKDIPESVAQGSAAAAKVLDLLSKEKIEKEPLVAEVNEHICNGCFQCVPVCPYGAIEEKEIRDRKGNLIKRVARINEALCAGCGSCSATCLPGAIDLKGFSEEQIYSEIESI